MARYTHIGTSRLYWYPTGTCGPAPTSLGQSIPAAAVELACNPEGEGVAALDGFDRQRRGEPAPNWRTPHAGAIPSGTTPTPITVDIYDTDTGDTPIIDQLTPGHGAILVDRYGNDPTAPTIGQRWQYIPAELAGVDPTFDMDRRAATWRATFIVTAEPSEPRIVIDQPRTLSIGNATTITIAARTATGQPLELEPEPGVTITVPADGTPTTYTYAFPYTGPIATPPDADLVALDITAPIFAQLADVATFTGPTATDLSIDATGGNLEGSTDDIPPNVRTLNLAAFTGFGDLAELPSGLEAATIAGTHTVTGDIAALPPSLAYIDIDGAGDIHGDIAALPPTIDTFAATTSGTGATITGAFADLPRTMTGRLRIHGPHIAGGNPADLPTTLTAIDLDGNANMIGDLANIPPAATSWRLTDDHAGTVGAHQVNNATAPIPAGIIAFDQRTGIATATDVGNILEALDDNSLAGGTVNVAGTNPAPSAAGTAAATSLTGKGWTVTTN